MYKKRRSLIQLIFLSGNGFVPVFASSYNSLSVGHSAYPYWVIGKLPKTEYPYFEKGNKPFMAPNEKAAFFWCQAALDLIQKYRLNPLRASRVLAYMNTALHDVGLTFASQDDETGLLVRHEFCGLRMLQYLFPEESEGGWRLQLELRLKSYSLDLQQRQLCEQQSLRVSDLSVQRAIADRSDPGGAMIQPPQGIAFPWRAAPPLWVSRPVEPFAPRWRTWLVDASIADVTPAPPTVDPVRYQKEIEEVWLVSKTLTDAQKAIAERWNLDLGTVTPPGVWVKWLLASKTFRELPTLSQTTVLSALTTAMQDAFIACWKVKFTWWTERPVTAIHRTLDKNFLPHVVTPAFPAYVSGHATISGAAATVLASFFPEQKQLLSGMAQEAADSRLYGGIHIRSDNEEGLKLGIKVGQLCLQKMMEKMT
jgi:hypothetical protein